MVQTISAAQIWEAALEELQKQVNKPNYNTWLSKTTGISFQDNKFVIGVPNTFVAEYLDKNQRSLIGKVLADLTHRDTRIEFQVTTNPYPLSRYGGRGKSVPAQQTSLPLFNPKYTFDSFVVGSCNRFAYNAALNVSQNPGQGYNPLFIYGEAGLGKTHLLHAIGHTALANNLNVLYVSAEQYTNELMSALREGNTEDFRNKYRSADMLLIDDVQFFSGKQQTGENFFHTFEVLHNANRQIAVTCDQSPKSIPFLQDRLSSRFEGGLVTDIQSPDFETRLAILQTKAKHDGVDVTSDVLEFIALQIQQNIRSLEGSLNRVVAYSRLLRTILTPELAAQALKNVAPSAAKSAPPTYSLIIEAVVNKFKLTPGELKGRKRDEATSLARQVAMYLLRQETDFSLTVIGRELGGRSAATVGHAYQKIATAINNDPSLRRKIVEIRQEIRLSPKI